MLSNQVRPQNWKALAPPIVNFTDQSSSLLRLPLPPLQATLQRLKNSLRPLSRSTDEYASVCRKIDDFGRSDGLGPITQEVLLQRKHETDNWLEEWWDDPLYFSDRGTVAVNVSAYTGFEPQPVHLPQTPAARAAALTYSTMLFRHGLRSGTLAPDTMRGVHLCMYAYRWMFDCCRIPGADGLDWCTTYANSLSPHDELGHVIVIRKNRFWKLKAQIGDKVVGMGDLIGQFQYIYDHTTEEDYPAIGALTASCRNTWAEAYTLLSSVPWNAAIFREIHSSAFVVSLDDSTPPPENNLEISKALWLGTLRSPTNPNGASRGHSSRYMDKPSQFIVFDNSVAGQVGEHSILDGTHYFRLCDELLAFLANPKSDFQLSPLFPLTTVPEPLDFDMTSIPEIYDAISKSQAFIDDLASTKSLSFLRIDYGKAAIKQFGVSPDGWAQMILQVAYARLAERFGGENGRVHPWPVCTHESATLRRFYKAREEIIRVVTDECLAFVQAMLRDTATSGEKLQLLKRAVKKHRQLASEAAMNEGVDNHMTGLHAAKPPLTPEPALFIDPLYMRASDAKLFTSSLFSSHVRVYGWGENNADGFGIAYTTGFDEYLQFTITSDCKLPNAEFAEEIKKASEEFYRLFTQPDTLSNPASESERVNVNTKL